MFALKSSTTHTLLLDGSLLSEMQKLGGHHFVSERKHVERYPDFKKVAPIT